MNQEGQFKEAVIRLYKRDERLGKPVIAPHELAAEAAARLGIEGDCGQLKQWAEEACRQHYLADQRRADRRMGGTNRHAAALEAYANMKFKPNGRPDEQKLQ